MKLLCLRLSVEEMQTHQSKHSIDIGNRYLGVVVFDKDESIVLDCLNQMFRRLWSRLADIQDRQLDGLFSCHDCLVCW